jgi:hypothetical protein
MNFHVFPNCEWILAALLVATPLDAGTIVSVTGTYGQAIELASSQQAAASWSSTVAYDDVAITADIQHLFTAMSFTGTAWLMSQIGPAATVSDEIASSSFTTTAFESTATVFTGLDLLPGTYYLVLAASPDSAGVSWLTTDTPFPPPNPVPAITTGSGVSYRGDFTDLGGVDTAFIPTSTFSGPSNDDLIFSVSGTQATPEPSSASMLLLGSLGLILSRLRRMRSNQRGDPTDL